MINDQKEQHYGERVGWLRAAVLGANDGILSTASLVVGVAAANAAPSEIVLAGLAGLVAGAMSMAAGEFVSVSSQADTEKADLRREQRELDTNIEYESQELALIYMKRGLDNPLAKEVAEQLMAHDALGAHARDELGHSETNIARPLQAAVTSGVSFSVGAALPLLLALFGPGNILIPIIAAGSLLFLAFLGGLAAWVGGANVWIGAGRVTLWGMVAMGTTAAIGSFFGSRL